MGSKNWKQKKVGGLDKEETKKKACLRKSDVCKTDKRQVWGDVGIKGTERSKTLRV